MSNEFKDITDEDLLREWNAIFPGYLYKLKDLKSLVDSIDRDRSKLLIIKTELEKRNIQVDEPNT